MCKEEGKVTRKEKLRKSLIVLFWAGLVVLAGSSYFYMQWSIPDRLNVVVDQEENFHFSLPVKVSLKSESEEVVLNNGSNIPQMKYICSWISHFPFIRKMKEHTI